MSLKYSPLQILQRKVPGYLSVGSLRKWIPVLALGVGLRLLVLGLVQVHHTIRYNFLLSD